MLHIGEKIKEVFESTGITVTAFAKKINTSRENIYGIFSRKSIDTDLLMKICKALNHDFFAYYSAGKDLEGLRKQLIVAEQEIAYLKKINSLLEHSQPQAEKKDYPEKKKGKK